MQPASFARRFARAPGGRAWVVYSIATIVGVLVCQVLAVLAFLSNDPNSPFNLIQRVQFFTMQAWIALLALRVLTSPAVEARPRPVGASLRRQPTAS